MGRDLTSVRKLFLSCKLGILALWNGLCNLFCALRKTASKLFKEDHRKGPGGGGGVLLEFMGGDVPLGP